MSRIYKKSDIPEHLLPYFKPAEYGAEETPAEYVDTMRAVFAEVRRVLADDGTLWCNLGDSYAFPPGSAGRQGNGQRAGRTFTAEGLRGTRSIPPKNLMMIPARVAIALQDDGWILRNDIIWHKPNAMPESVADRLAGRYEHVFMLAKNQRYYFDLDAVREPFKGIRHGRTWDQRKALGEPTKYGLAGQRAAGTGAFFGDDKGANPGDVWSIGTRPGPEAHFATFPIELPIRCIKAACKPGGTVLDPFSGSGTTGHAARMLGRKYVGIDLNPAYHDLAVKRFAQGVLDFESEAVA